MTKLRNVRYIALIKLIDGIDELAAQTMKPYNIPSDQSDKPNPNHHSPETMMNDLNNDVKNL